MTNRISLEPADIAFKAQTIARRALSSRIAEFLKEQWGEGWLERLNKLIEEDNKTQSARYSTWKARPPIGWGKDGPLWDNNNMLRALRDAVRTMRHLGPKTGQIDRTAEDLRTSRNQLAHEGEFGPADWEFVTTYINKATHLMQMIGGSSGVTELQQLKALLLSPEGLSIATGADTEGKKDGSSVTSAEYRTLLAMMEQVLDRIPKDQPAAPPAAKDEAALPTGYQSDEPLMAKSSPSQTNTTVSGRRRGSVPPPRPGLVLFPNISELSDKESDFGYISASVIKAHSFNTLPHITGFEDPSRRNLYYKIIDAGHFNESDDSQILPTKAKINPGDFIGDSFGLAAVLADKIARHGLADVLDGGHLIATGVIELKGQGAVGKIKGFEAKVRLLNKEAREGSLFIFPYANLETTDQTTREFLKHATAQGHYKWRAIKHLDELADLFPTPEPAGTVGHDHSASLGLQMQPEPKVAVAETVVSASVGDQKHPRRAVFGSAVIFGMVLLGGVYLFGEWQSWNTVDPVVVQASDERLSRLAVTASLVASPPVSATSCRELLQASSAIVEIDRQRLLPVHKSALDSSARCSATLSESEVRWNKLTAIGEALAKGQPVDINVAAAARDGLTTFDLSEVDNDGRKALIAAIDASLSNLRAVQSRWTTLAESISRWKANELSTEIDAVAAAYNALSADDRAKAIADQKALVQAGQSAVEAVRLSDRRLLDIAEAFRLVADGTSAAELDFAERALLALTPLDKLRANRAQIEAIDATQRVLAQSRFAVLLQAAKAYERDPTRANAMTLSAAATGLTKGDREIVGREQQPALFLSTSAQIELINSAAREKQVLDAVATLNAAESSGTGFVTAYLALINATESLLPFDNPQGNPVLRAAVARADRARATLAASDDRISLAVLWAERAASFGQNAPSEVGQSFEAAHDALTQLDKDRLTAEQANLLDSVCGISGPKDPWALVPKGTCISPNRKNTTIVLQPKQALP